MSDALEAMAKANRDGQTKEPVSAGHLINELEKSFQWAMNPGTNALSSRLTHLSFFGTGRSPAHLFLNLSQQAQVTFPWLVSEMHGKIGSGSVAAALAKANKDFIASNRLPALTSVARQPKAPCRLEGEFNGDMGRALKALEKESGKTDKTRRTAYPGYPKKTLGSGRSPTYANSPRARRGSFMWPSHQPRGVRHRRLPAGASGRHEP